MDEFTIEELNVVLSSMVILSLIEGKEGMEAAGLPVEAWVSAKKKLCRLRNRLEQENQDE